MKTHENPSHSKKVTVMSGMMAKKIRDLYFLDTEALDTVTKICEQYDAHTANS